MRVESAKNNQTDKKDASNFKPEKSLFDSSNPLKNARAAGAAQPAKGAFEKILTEARRQTGGEKDKPLNGAEAKDAAETSETDKEKQVNRRSEEKAESKNKGDGREGGQSDTDEDSTAFAAALLSNEAKSAALGAHSPAARSILHIADLERIVSFIRTQNFGDAQQILISLKHSVLEGLQIRLSLNQSGNLKAEFLAMNEQIKKQLKKRERELLDILKQRSARFSEIDILLL